MAWQLRLMVRSCMSIGLCVVMLATIGILLGTDSSYGAEVGGIYTEPTTKDLGEVTKVDFFKGLKFRGWIDTYFEGNFNDPKRSVVEANQNLSVLKSRDLTIEGRTFDVHDRSFSLSLAELEIERVPGVGEVGFKLDLAFGDTQDIIIDTIKAASGKSSVSDFDRYVQHASLSYVVPIGKGLRLDVGKFVTHIGGETIESIKNHNYSHAFLFTYAIPTLQTGIRVHYDWSDEFSTEFYVLNGWNVTSDNNKAKTFGPSVTWAPSPQLSVTFNYLVGNEQTDNDKFFNNLRHLLDAQLNYAPIEELNFHLNLDYGREENATTPNGIQTAQWGGVTGWVRYRVNKAFEPTLRVEWYRDKNGFTTGVPQTLVGVTLTMNYKIGFGKFANVLLRPEYRFDHSNEDFFTHRGDFQARKTQHTLGVGAVVYF